MSAQIRYEMHEMNRPCDVVGCGMAVARISVDAMLAKFRWGLSLACWYFVCAEYLNMLT
jgi:hypothetical protein